jgi:hypothetical protein
MKNHLLFAATCIIFFSFLFITRSDQILSSLSLNFVNTIMYRSLDQEQIDAATRKKSLALAAVWFPGDVGERPNSTEELSMIPATLRGLYYYRLRDWQNAAIWYDIAAKEEPIPENQKQLLVSPWMKLSPSGNFTLEANADEWQFRADTAPGATKTQTDLGTLGFCCSESVDEPKKATLVWDKAFNIPYHHTLVLRAKAEIGTTLILAMVIDGQLNRYIVHEGTEIWEDFTVPLDGDHVNYIYVSIRENSLSSKKSCMAEIDSLTFLLDE